MLQTIRHHFPVQFSLLFQMLCSILLAVLPFKTPYTDWWKTFNSQSESTKRISLKCNTRSTPSERAIKTALKSDVAFWLTYFCLWKVVWLRALFLWCYWSNEQCKIEGPLTGTELVPLQGLRQRQIKLQEGTKGINIFHDKRPETSNREKFWVSGQTWHLGSRVVRRSTEVIWTPHTRPLVPKVVGRSHGPLIPKVVGRSLVAKVALSHGPIAGKVVAHRRSHRGSTIAKIIGGTRLSHSKVVGWSHAWARHSRSLICEELWRSRGLRRWWWRRSLPTPLPNEKLLAAIGQQF